MIISHKSDWKVFVAELLCCLIVLRLQCSQCSKSIILRFESQNQNNKLSFSSCELNPFCKWFTYDAQTALCYLKDRRGYLVNKNRTEMDRFTSGATFRDGCTPDPCEAEWSTLIGRDPMRYSVLIGWTLLCWRQGLCHNNKPKGTNRPLWGAFYLPWGVLLWLDKSATSGSFITISDLDCSTLLSGSVFLPELPVSLLHRSQTVLPGCPGGLWGARGLRALHLHWLRTRYSPARQIRESQG